MIAHTDCQSNLSSYTYRHNSPTYIEITTTLIYASVDSGYCLQPQSHPWQCSAKRNYLITLTRTTGIPATDKLIAEKEAEIEELRAELQSQQVQLIRSQEHVQKLEKQVAEAWDELKESEQQTAKLRISEKAAKKLVHTAEIEELQASDIVLTPI